MKNKILSFLLALEAAIPPPRGLHHVIAAAKYGSEESGWNDRLALIIALPDGRRTFFLDEGDLEREAASLAEEVRQLNAAALAEEIRNPKPSDLR